MLQTINNNDSITLESKDLAIRTTAHIQLLDADLKEIKNFDTVALSSAEFIGKNYAKQSKTVLDTNENSLADGTVLSTLAGKVTEDDIKIATNAAVVSGAASDCLTDFVRRAKFMDLVKLSRSIVATCNALGIGESHQKRYIKGVADIIKKERNALGSKGIFLPSENKSFMVKNDGLGFTTAKWSENSWVNKKVIDATKKVAIESGLSVEIEIDTVKESKDTLNKITEMLGSLLDSDKLELMKLLRESL
jgi:hypothetical protein